MECGSPVSTVPPVDVFPIAVETVPESAAPLAPRTPQPSEDPDGPPQGEREGGEGQWYDAPLKLLLEMCLLCKSLITALIYFCLGFVLRTSSTSVEQARERGYHRALLLSDHRKDTG